LFESPGLQQNVHKSQFLYAMKTALIRLLPFFFPLLLWSKPVPPDTALDLAFKHLDIASAQQGLQLHSTKMAGRTPRDRTNFKRLELPAFQNSTDGTVPFHVVSDSAGGFVIIAGDDRAIPVLASSLTGEIDPQDLPPSFVAWMKYYQRQIDAVVSRNLEQNPAVASMWQQLAEGQSITTGTLETYAVDELLTTLWNQSPYYNQLCPYDSGANARTLTGCVATAMAQIMAYWKFPAAGNGSSKYNHHAYGVLNADYGSTQYQWNQMPQRLTASSSNDQVQAVATLMYHCGVSVQMDYGVDGSGISDITKVVDSLRTYFNYATTVSLVKRWETTDSIWTASLQNELNSGRPVFYVGFDPNGEGGHAWVCDGSDNSNRFHMNWGWNGSANGYYTLNALVPTSDFNFNDYQMAVIGIAPQESSRDGATLKLYRSVSVTPNPADEGNAITVQGDVINTSNTSFSGSIAAGVFSNQNRLLLTIGEVTEDNLQAGYHYSSPLTFTRANTGSLQPGSYYISILYKPTGRTDWIKASDEDYSNWISFKINGETNSELSLYAPLTIGNDGIINQNTTFDLSFNIYNSGSSTFNGAVEVDFYNSDGSYRSDIPTIYHYDISNLEANHYYTNNRAKTINGGVNLPPGEYLAAVTHKSTSGSNWELTGSGSYQNPVRVFVQEGNDPYEPNDDYFTYLIPHYANNYAAITTENASISSEDDIDLFWVDFDAGYDYQINARVHDSWNSGNGKTYTTDVFWVMVTPDDSTYFYDDIMDQPLRLNNGGYIAIGVGGWGYNLGTYDLEININRLARGTLDPNDPRNYITPLYRFYRAGNDSHFFTANEAEKNSIISTQPANFWVYEGISQRVLHTQTANAVPVYRMFNKISKSHFYTASPTELASIQQRLGHVFSLEGVAFYALDSEVYGAMPVYRFFSTATASHFFTISKAERDQIIATIPDSKLRYEGVAWYAYP